MPATCAECPKLKDTTGNNGLCLNPELKWIIAKKLAKQQAVCDDTLIGEAELIQVLTPLGQKALISKEAYEKEKNGENFWRPNK